MQAVATVDVVTLRKFSADIPAETLKAFDDWVERTGLVKRRALIAAMEIIRYVPPHVREAIMQGDHEWVDDYLRGLQWPRPEWGDAPSTSRRADSTTQAVEQVLDEASGRVHQDHPKGAAKSKRGGA